VLEEYRISSKDWIKEKCIRMKISQEVREKLGITKKKIIRNPCKVMLIL
jgi:hypothetical protein